MICTTFINLPDIEYTKVNEDLLVSVSWKSYMFDGYCDVIAVCVVVTRIIIVSC